MSFMDALDYGLMHSEAVCEQYDRVMTAHDRGIECPCLLFAIDGEAFFFGFDGVDYQAGKHTAKRSAVLIQHDRCLIIR
ncbi:MAG: hypothetical protein IJ662_02640 [Clostridia bacterium]|nr:hypothetical protein [Clostridia bacterium]